tara:strand:- start:58 stop:522 length:465 start_codon:yes stop_codon:yes gene_type:complete
MLIFIKNHFIIVFLSFFIILTNCKLQEPYKNHGIVYLKNRSDKLQINSTNKNDVIQIIGQPHSKSINNENEWFYIERILTKGEYHKLGQNILKENNILVLNFDKYGVLQNKTFLDKNSKNKILFSEKETTNELTQKSFIERFLSSVRTKMYGNR